MISLKDLYHIVAAPELLAAPSIYQKDKPKVDSKYIGFDSYIFKLIPQQNASTFAIFYEYENPKLLFQFYILFNFIFLLMNALVYVTIDQGIH